MRHSYSGGFRAGRGVHTCIYIHTYAHICFSFVSPTSRRSLSGGQWSSGGRVRQTNKENKRKQEMRGAPRATTTSMSLLAHAPLLHCNLRDMFNCRERGAHTHVNIDMFAYVFLESSGTPLMRRTGLIIYFCVDVIFVCRAVHDKVRPPAPLMLEAKF